eukprot:GDKJ01025720.1.p1 GENE.GDKJ01025720.1~~GDKJ01025720.1.p1  ORF type:complete len:120 (-),score=24.46 GDKJ01025720.1:45-404(-)
MNVFRSTTRSPLSCALKNALGHIEFGVFRNNYRVSTHPSRISTNITAERMAFALECLNRREAVVFPQGEFEFVIDPSLSKISVKRSEEDLETFEMTEEQFKQIIRVLTFNMRFAQKLML